MSPPRAPPRPTVSGRRSERPGPPLRLVAFDMDGTLVDAMSSWAEVHHFFHDSNEAALEAFMADEIDDEEFTRRDLAIWHRHRPGLTVADLEKILSTVPLMQGAKALVGALHARKIRTAIISGGLDVLASRVQRELGIDVALANGFITGEQGRLLRGNIRVPVKQKERVLRELQSSWGIGPEETASVGNSEIDVGLFRASRIGIAFSPDDDIVRRHATYIVEGKDMSPLIPLLLEDGRGLDAAVGSGRSRLP